MPLEEVLRRANQRADYPGGRDRDAVAGVKGHITGLYFLTRVWNSPQVLPKSRKPRRAISRLRAGGGACIPSLPRVLPRELRNWSSWWTTTRPASLRRRHVLAGVRRPSRLPTNLVLTLHDDSVGVLPLADHWRAA